MDQTDILYMFDVALQPLPHAIHTLKHVGCKESSNVSNHFNSASKKYYTCMHGGAVSGKLYAHHVHQ